ncbi:restriction endonuclease subunit R [Burkholderia pseudomallei]|uniref:restriction endonuclease subunit R n=1 Tax=Burkholderia pseudomallei TaxID=28450 RepID=UPI0009B1E7DA|nr:restriction endonuclease subunit R [Burkholderia pseudomallei]MBM5579911.1 restriction endonuclease subunit R [Burkholderia pseudomallei]MBM5586516.1 restriction endonuclease subunit R [Burkholderia pseudomallei]RPA08044.1 restriction endonuclease subunit R [Burkholderia pseudomallei]
MNRNGSGSGFDGHAFPHLSLKRARSPGKRNASITACRRTCRSVRANANRRMRKGRQRAAKRRPARRQSAYGRRRTAHIGFAPAVPAGVVRRAFAQRLKRTTAARRPIRRARLRPHGARLSARYPLSAAEPPPCGFRRSPSLATAHRPSRTGARGEIGRRHDRCVGRAARTRGAAIAPPLKPRSPIPAPSPG